jgi:hypothetical protein
MAGATAAGTGMATGTAALAGWGEAVGTAPVEGAGAGGGIMAGMGICGM